MADEIDHQLDRIENTVAEIALAVQRLRDDGTAARQAGFAEINQRLRRFLEQKQRA